jgi:hypothetical protein
MKLCVGLNKKRGLPGYSSIGASCHVEVELCSTLFDQELEQFHKYVRTLYQACARDVDEQLARWHPFPRVANGDDAAATEGAGEESDPQLDRAPGRNGHGMRLAAATLSPPASAKQLEFARQLAAQVDDLGPQRLEQLSHCLLGKPLAELSRADAAVLLETLRNLRAGKLSLAEFLGEEQG